MKIEKLEELYDVKVKIREIEIAIDKIKRMETSVVSDVVKASMEQWPYIGVKATVIGFSIEEEEVKNRKIRRKMKILRKMLDIEETLEIQVLEFINSVESSRLRRIMQKRYINMKQWTDIAKEMKLDASYPYKLVKQYFKKNGGK